MKTSAITPSPAQIGCGHRTELARIDREPSMKRHTMIFNEPRSLVYVLCRGLIQLALVLTCLMDLGAKALGQTTYYWSSSAATSGYWSGSFWWNGSANTTLGGSERIYFDNSAYPAMNNDASTTARWGIDFLSGSAARTISGSTANTFYDYGGNAPFIQNDSGLTQTINFPIVDGNANGANALNLIANSGNLVFGGTVSASGGARNIFPQGAANITFNGAINDGSSAVMTVTKLGGGTIFYDTANNYSGSTYISAGTLQIDSSGTANNSTIQLGDSASTGASATFTLGAIGGGQSLANTINVRSGSSGAKLFTSLATSGNNTLSGSITASDNFGANSTAGGNLIFSGAVKSDGTTVRTLTTLTGTGTTTLQGVADNSYLQAMVNAGTLVLNKASDSSHHALGGTTETVAGGTLQLSGSGGDQIQDGANVTVSSGAFELNGQSETINSISLNGTGISSAGALVNSGLAATLTLNAGSTLAGAASIGGTGDVTIGGSGAITASSATTLTKVGNNKLTLSNGGGVDNLNLLLTVNAGTVVLNKTGTTGTGAGKIHAVGNVTINSGAAVQLSGSGGYQIYDGNNPTVSSGGVLDLNGQNQTFTGTGPTISGTGISSGGALINGTGSATLTSKLVLGAASSVGGAGNLTISDVISGGYSLSKVGAGTLTLIGPNTYSGDTMVRAGTLRLQANHTLPIGTSVAIGNTSTSGTLDLGGYNQQVAGLTAAGIASAQTIGNSSTSSDSILTYNSSWPSTFGGVIKDSVNGGTRSVALVVSGGTLTLKGANTYSGGTSITSGTLVVGQDNALPTGTTVTLGAGSNSGLLQLGDSSHAGSQTLAGLVTSGTGTANAVVGGSPSTSTLALNSAGSITYAGRLGGDGANQNILALTMAGAGTLTLNSANTYSSGTTLSSGQLNINNGGSSSANSAIGTGTFTISGGTIDNTSSGDVTLAPNNAQNWNGDFTYAGSVHNLNLGSGAVTLGASRQVTVSANTLTVGGIISGSSKGITKAGTGTLTLTSANTYSGNTTISGGELVGSTAGSCANSVFTVSSGATNGVKLAAAGGQWTCGGLTYNSGTTYADFDFASFTPSTSTAPLSVGALTANATVKVLLRNVGFPATVGSKYPLIHYTGTDPSVSSFSLLSSLPLSVTNAGGSLVVDTASKNVSASVGLVAPNFSTNCAPGISRRITLTEIQDYGGLSSSRGSPAYSFTGIGSASAGGTVIYDANNIQYTYPTSGSPMSDSFSYTITDGSVSATATVTLAFTKQSGAASASISVTNGVAAVTLYGIPGLQYDVQRSTDNMNSWTTLTTAPPLNVTPPIATGSDGKVTFTDNFSDLGTKPSSAFYRTIQH